MLHCKKTKQETWKMEIKDKQQQQQTQEINMCYSIIN